MIGSDGKSEVAQLRTQIEMEFEAMQLALTGLASGTARHAIIASRMQYIDTYQHKLAEHIGEDEATEIVCDLYNTIMEEQSREISQVQENMSIMTKSLWILICHNYDTDWDELIPLYAASREDAENQAQQWISQNKRPLVRIELRPCPRGFTLSREELPGRI